MKGSASCALGRWFFRLVLSGWEWTLLLYPSASDKSFYFFQRFGNSWEVLSGLEASILSSMPICYYTHTHVNRVMFSYIDLEERFSHCLIKTESFLFFPLSIILCGNPQGHCINHYFEWLWNKCAIFCSCSYLICMLVLYFTTIRKFI